MESQGVSDLDGETPSTKVCSHCLLNIQDELMSGFHCTMYHNVKMIQAISRFSQQVFYFGIGFLVMSIFYSEFRQWNFYIIVAMIVPMVLMNQVKMKLHYRGVEKKYRIVHQLRTYQRTREITYYYEALAITEEVSDQLSERHIMRLLEELTESVLLAAIFNPLNLIENWSKALNMTPERMMDLIFANTDILSGISPVGGNGLLPDILPYADQQTQLKIIEKIAEGCELLDKVSSTEKLYFLQDLYLVYDDIQKEILENDDWKIISDTYYSFEPDEPPKNAREAFNRQMQEMQRQMQQQQIMKTD